MFLLFWSRKNCSGGWPLCKYLHDERKITKSLRARDLLVRSWTSIHSVLNVRTKVWELVLVLKLMPSFSLSHHGQLFPLHCISQHSPHPTFEWSPSLTRLPSPEGPVGCQDSWPPANHGLMSRSSFTLTFNCTFTTLMFCAWAL